MSSLKISYMACLGAVCIVSMSMNSYSEKLGVVRGQRT